MCVQSTPALTERRGNAMLFSPTAMGIRGFMRLPSVIHFSISPANCQGRAADAVAAFAGIQRRRPLAPEIICASQFARLQKILNIAAFTDPAQRSPPCSPPAYLSRLLSLLRKRQLRRNSRMSQASSSYQPTHRRRQQLTLFHPRSLMLRPPPAPPA